MPNHDRKPVTLEKLLQLKREEKPAPEFWESFDKELETRRLRALVERSPAPLWSRLFVMGRHAALVLLPIASAAAFAWVVFDRSGGLAPETEPHVASLVAEPSASPGNGIYASEGADSSASQAFAEREMRNQFISDALSSSSDRAHFQKVLYTPSISAFSQDRAVHYISDSVGDGGVKLGSSSSGRLSHF